MATEISRAMDLYISQHPELTIVGRGLSSDDDDTESLVLEYNIHPDSRDEIDVTCTALGGVPKPTFHW